MKRTTDLERDIVLETVLGPTPSYLVSHDPPEVAIVLSGVVDPKIGPPPDYKRPGTKTISEGETLQKFTKTRENIIESISLSSINRARIRVSYAKVLSPGWVSSDIGSSSGDIYQRDFPRECVIDPDKVSHIYSRLSKSKLDMSLAIEKIRLSRRRHSSEEKLIDLGTCMEIIFMHSDYSSNAEITNKISSRAAWF
ncbi:hypothetical protein [Henriciella barbarensis]|uniref:hypothetical protein n=1 Tax=Henriciella barbarensis TaxID=86342 RepID=UPI0011C34E4C|nr:hypothetical protein [Henriciella barbarensis]